MNHITIKKRKSRRQKRISNAIRAGLCVLSLAAAATGIHLLTPIVLKSLSAPASEPDSGSPASAQDLAKNAKGNDTTPKDLAADEPMEEDSPLTICIDAGHGGKDVGSGDESRWEKDDVLKLALAIADYLEKQDAKVVLTRSGDTYPYLSDRCETANEAKADYFLSLHRNTGEGTGVEAWISHNASEETDGLAQNIMNGLDSVGIQRNRGIKSGSQSSPTEDYYLNLHSNMPSCILELGFINNAADNQLFDDNLTAYAKAIGDAFLTTYSTYHPKDSAGSSKKGNTDKTDRKALNNDTEDKDNGTDSTDSGRSPESSHTLNNPQIDNIAALDNTTLDWGPGVNFDELNRPAGALNYQEKYGKYSADFIRADSENKKIIYLTMDEGYEYGCTESILNTLKEKQVPTVFFVTKAYAREEPDLVKRMIDEGHAVGNHSVTHPANGLPSQSTEEQQSEINGCHDYIKENFDYEMHLFRYPAGKFSEQSLAVVNNCNYKSIFWSFAYLDYDVNNQPDQGEALERLINRLHPGAIYLLHAESTTNTAILGQFIDQTRAAGYEFALLD